MEEEIGIIYFIREGKYFSIKFTIEGHELVI